MKTKSPILRFLLSSMIICLIMPVQSQIKDRMDQAPDMSLRSKSLMVTPMTSGITADQMVQNILGGGVSYNNVNYNGAEIASGLFSGGYTAGIDLDEGIILSSGSAEFAIGPNDETGISQSNGVPGDPDLDALGFQTNDASVLEFDFIPEDDFISFNFVMGSEEYPEYINSYQDVFAFFLDGENIAWIPGTTIPISIGTVNHEQNSEYYVSNTDPIVHDIQCDGFTVAFQLFASVTPNTTHHIKMAVADVNDFALDTWIFLESGSFVAVNQPPVATGFPTEIPEIMVGDTYSLSVEFNSPEPDQVTNVTINPDVWPGFSSTITPGQTALVEFELIGMLDNVGDNVFEFIATDNGDPVLTTTVSLTVKVINPDPQIEVTPPSLSESLYSDETSTQFFTIANNGDGVLDFTLEDVETSKRLKIKSVKKSQKGDFPDDYLNYLNGLLENAPKSVTEVAWLSEDPLLGSVLPGEEIQIEVGFDATGLDPDIYSAQILVNSNDPVNPQVVVQVTLQVLGVNCIHITTDDNENNALAGIPDYDMDEYLYNDDPIAPIEFNIFIEEVTVESAQLNLYAWDVDEIDGEVDEVYVNGNHVGNLTGANDEWSTTVFNVDPSYLVPGPNGKNLIQVFIDVFDDGWAVNVDWGQLIINNCMGGNAWIRYADLDKAMYMQGDDVEITVEVDTDIPTQDVIIETNLLDENMINIAGTSNTITIQLEEDEPLTQVLTLPADATLGSTYHAQVIVYDASTYIQQDFALVPFLIWDGNGLLNCLDPGWQIISSCFNPSDPMLEVLMADVNAVEALVIMLNLNGFYWPSQNINLLGEWDCYTGYKIKMAEPGCIIFDGDEVLDKMAMVYTGINYLPVLSTFPVAAADIFDQFGPDMLYAFDVQNSLVYWPDGGIYTLNTLQPGIGYLVSMLADGNTIFPETDATNQLQPNEPQKITGSPWTVTNTGMPHIVSISQEALADLSPGDIIAAFNAEGICVGVAQYSGEAENLALVVYGDDFTTEAIDGMSANDPIHLEIYNPATEVQQAASPVWDLSMPQTGYFADYGASSITELKVGATSVGDDGLNNISIYPNPSNGTFHVNGIETTTQISVTNAAGQMIYSIESDQPVEINLSEKSQGIYYLRLTTDSGIRVEKVMVK
ncbi:MAG: choice-of-anchor L domain-containing protein [Bacteroidales bacterium]